MNHSTVYCSYDNTYCKLLPVKEKNVEIDIESFTTEYLNKDIKDMLSKLNKVDEDYDDPKTIE